MSENICESCTHLVLCGEKDGKKYGFCIWQDLYTYTERSRCKDRIDGTPMDVKEFEEYGQR